MLLLKDHKIIGLDPGSQVTGYAVLISHRNAPRSMSDFSAEDYGVFQASPKLSFTQRVGFMHKEVYELIQQVGPHHCVIEDAYVRGFPRSSLKLAQVKGALIAAALTSEVEVHEMTASHAKKTITGGGAANKEQVASMLLQSFLRSSRPHPAHNTPNLTPLKEDASDALALALAWSLESTLKAQSSNSALKASRLL